MSHRVCPWWMGYVLLCPVRRLGQNPDRILAPYVRSGMTVLEVGPGMGFFTLPMARMVGPGGKVVCVDVREEMLAGVQRRAAKAGLVDRIELRTCPSMTLGIDDWVGKVDFVLLFAVVHEVPDASGLFAEIAQAMRPNARCLVAEPAFHVSAQEFDRTLAAAERNGLRLASQAEERLESPLDSRLLKHVLSPDLRESVPAGQEAGLQWLMDAIPVTSLSSFRKTANLSPLFDFAESVSGSLEKRYGQPLLLLLDRAEEVP